MIETIRGNAAAWAVIFVCALGASFVFQMVSAPRSDAYTTSKCISYLAYKGAETRSWRCWRDYNWWEESYFGGSHVDGWYG